MASRLPYLIHTNSRATRFAADLLVEMRVALENLQIEKRVTLFIDPFDGQRTIL